MQALNGFTAFKLCKIEILYPTEHWKFTEHCHHDYHELVYVLNGDYHVRIDGQQLNGSAGNVFFYPLGLAHFPEYKVGGDTSLVVTQWQENEPEIEKRPRQVKDASGRILSTLKWINDLFPTDDARQIEVMHCLLKALLFEYASANLAPEQEMIGRVRRFMQEHLDEELDLDRLAKVALMSKFHFLRIFREAQGITPMRFLRHLRLEAARTLLTNTDLPLKTIAKRTGFANRSHLSRLIREELGQAPSALRKVTITYRV